MGWKAFNLFASIPGGSALTTFPPHHADKALAFLKLLGGTYENHGDRTFEDGIYPSSDDELYIGAYGHAFVLGSIPLAASAFRGDVPPIVRHLHVTIPGCRVLAVLLHSAVDLYGYSWFENGRLLSTTAPLLLQLTASQSGEVDA
jgi:hypothetical protein